MPVGMRYDMTSTATSVTNDMATELECTLYDGEHAEANVRDRKAELALLDNNDLGIWHSLLHHVYDALGRIQNSYDEASARDFLEKFGFGRICAGEDFWDLIHDLMISEFAETRETCSGANTFSVLSREDVTEAARLAASESLPEALSREIGLLCDFYESYLDAMGVWCQVLYGEDRRFEVVYDLGLPDRREILLQKGYEVNIEAYAKAHYDHHLPIEDCFYGGDVDDRPLQVRLG